jgi:hypothetical protein
MKGQYLVITPKMMMAKMGDNSPDWPEMPPVGTQIHYPTSLTFTDSIRDLSTLEGVWGDPLQASMLRKPVLKTSKLHTILEI